MIGYARVSTLEQNPALQTDALKGAGCVRIFVDHVSGSTGERLELAKLLEQLQPGNTLVVWRLDRLGRSIRHLIDLVADLDGRGVGFRSLRESIDTTTPGGRLVFHVFAALAEFERDLVRERTMAGLQAARARGRNGGRPVKMTPAKINRARQMYAAENMRVDEIAMALGVSRASIYRYVQAAHTP